MVSKGYPLLAILTINLILSPYASTLSTDYYCRTCPNLIGLVRPVIQAAISREARTAASIVRLFFHDCFVNGCDGSLLLDDTPTFTGEQTARPIRKIEVIDQIKDAVERDCPGIVSCADILALAASQSVGILGGPTIPTMLGRLDARTANKTDVQERLAAPFFNLSQIIGRFQAVGLSLKDVVALSGAHTIGFARCSTFRGHIWNDTNIDLSFALERRNICPGPQGTFGGDNNLAPIDVRSWARFDNGYFVNLLGNRGLLHSDQELFNNNRYGATDALVRLYASSEAAFFTDFVRSMLRMGDLMPRQGTPLEVRRSCGRVN